MEKVQAQDLSNYKTGTLSLLRAALKQGIDIYKFIDNERIFLLERDGKKVWMRGPRLSISNPVTLWVIKDKYLTKRVLSSINIPVPAGNVAKSLEEAKNIFSTLKTPLVIKPRKHEGGKGVFLHIDSHDQLEKFFFKSLSYDGEVVIEEEIVGIYYRVTMVNHEVAGVLETHGLYVQGDGVHSVQQLIDKYNNQAKIPYKITQKTHDILSFQNISLDDRLEAGKDIQLSFSGSESGIWIDRTDDIATENRELLRRLTMHLDLKVVGIDIIAKDISKPITSLEYPGYVLEVNGAPEFNFHLHPHVGKPRDIGEKVINMLFE